MILKLSNVIDGGGNVNKWYVWAKREQMVQFNLNFIFLYNINDMQLIFT